MKKFVPIFLFLTVLFLTHTGCKKDKDQPLPEDKTTTVAQDKANIKSALSGVSNCIIDIQHGAGAKAVINFLDADSIDVHNADWIVDLVDSIANLVDLDGLDNDNKFDFTLNAGTYTYQHGSKKWIKTASPSDKIILLFPADESSTTNNAVFTINKYTDQNYLIDGETFWLPKEIIGNILVDGVEVFSINGTYNYVVSGNITLPTMINTVIYFAPYTFTFKGDRVTSKDFTGSITIANNSGCSMVTAVEVNLIHDDYETLEWEDGVDKISGSFTSGNFKIQTSVDVKMLGPIVDPTISQINAYTTAEILYDGKKIADIILYEGTSEDQVHVVYKDGTQEDSKVYWDPFIRDLEQGYLNLFGTWYD